MIAEFTFLFDEVLLLRLRPALYLVDVLRQPFRRLSEYYLSAGFAASTRGSNPED